MTGTESCISACTLRITNRELFWRLCTAPKNVFYLAVTQTLFLSLICQPTSKDINPHMSKHYLFLWNVKIFFRERLLSTHTHTHTHKVFSLREAALSQKKSKIYTSDSKRSWIKTLQYFRLAWVLFVGPDCVQFSTPVPSFQSGFWLLGALSGWSLLD